MPNFTQTLELLEEEQETSDDEYKIPPDDIVAYNELRSCADIFRMYQTGQLEIPEFQRDDVWTAKQKSIFIDSLAKQLPIPSLCISFDTKSGQRLVIDGSQRMRTIVDFLSVEAPLEKNWKLSDSEEIDPNIRGLTNKEIKVKFNNIFSSIENVTLPITVLRCNLDKENHREYIYMIFHRLNTGAITLSNQEIRNCVYSGQFNALLKECVRNENFIKLFDINPSKKTYRLRHEEFVLRFFAFYTQLDSYNGKLSFFLNKFQSDQRKINDIEILNFKELFEQTTNFIINKISYGKKLTTSKTINEALFIGIAKNIEYLKNIDSLALKQKKILFDNEALFSVTALKEGLAQKDKVIGRIKKAIEIFKD